MKSDVPQSVFATKYNIRFHWEIRWQVFLFSCQVPLRDMYFFEDKISLTVTLYTCALTCSLCSVSD